MDGGRIVKLRSGVDPHDAVNKKQLDRAVSCLTETLEDVMCKIKCPRNQKCPTNKRDWYRFDFQQPCKKWGQVAIHCGFAYFTSTMEDTVSRVNLNDISECVEKWATKDQGLNKPRGIAIFEGHVYVVNNGLNTISKINIQNPNIFEKEWCDADNSGLSKPFGIAIHKGYAYVTNYD